MPRTREQIEQAAAEAEAWLDQLDPATTPARDTTDLRQIGLALYRIADAERDLADAVAAARASGRSWADIGMILGISKQAAQVRFGEHQRKSA